MENYRTGAGGCGLWCAVRPTKSGNYIFEDLWAEENYTEFHCSRISSGEKKALMILETAENEKRIPGSYETRNWFPDGCSQKLLLLTTVFDWYSQNRFDLIRS